MKYKACLFDLDGTLIDSVEDLADSMNAVLESKGFRTHSINDYRGFIGDGIANLVKRAIFPNDYDEIAISEAITAMRKEYRKRYLNKTRLYPGFPKVLDVLTEKEISLCILSNKPDSSVQQIVEKLLYDWNFVVARGAVEGIPIKPDPALALKIVEETGVSASDFIYFGDSGVDIQTAIGAGMTPVGVTWGYRPEAELWSAGARYVIHTTDEIIRFF